MTAVSEHEQGRKKFLGSLLGAAIGDAVGASREGRGMASQREIQALASDRSPLRYTDDTHMTIGVAESLVECEGFDAAHMAGCFVRNYQAEPWRGYGPGPPRVFRLMENGVPWNEAAAQIYPGGSFGNGAAMRVAPIGLFFWNRQEELREAAQESSLITHSHPLGVEGAVLQAAAVAHALAQDPSRPLDTSLFASHLLELASEDIYRAKIAQLDTLLKSADDRPLVVRQLGNGIEAFNSVPTAIFSFLAHPRDFPSAVLYAVSLGGDTDTIASMAGAIAGAYPGIDGLPVDWQGRLENRDYISGLGDRLWEASLPLGRSPV